MEGANRSGTQLVLSRARTGARLQDDSEASGHPGIPLCAGRNDGCTWRKIALYLGFLVLAAAVACFSFAQYRRVFYETWPESYSFLRLAEMRTGRVDDLVLVYHDGTKIHERRLPPEIHGPSALGIWHSAIEVFLDGYRPVIWDAP